MRNVLVAVLLAFTASVCAQEAKPPELTPEEQKLAEAASKLGNDGVTLYRQGKINDAVEKVQQSLELRRKIYPVAKHPDGHPDVATSLNNLGFLLQARGTYEQALPYFEQALAMRRKLYSAPTYPVGNADVAASLHNLGHLLVTMGRPNQSRPFYEAALAMRRKLYSASEYPDGHPDLAASVNNMGFLLNELGELERALPCFEEALAIKRKLYPLSKYPDGHSDLLLSISNCGIQLEQLGALDKALPQFELALAMSRTLYPPAKHPEGHSAIARCLSNLGRVLQLQKLHQKSLAYYEEALAIQRKLYPVASHAAGHPELAAALSNLSVALQLTRSFEKAEEAGQLALEMRRRLYPGSKYPSGHLDLASSQMNLGSLHWARGEYDRAQTHLEQALAIRQKLYPASQYPAGHAHLAATLQSLGYLHLTRAHWQHALPLFEQALTIEQNQLARVLAHSSEEDGLAYAQAQSPIRDIVLSATARVSETDLRAYRVLWDGKAALTRVLEQRHAAARVAGTEHQGVIARLRDSRRRTEQLVRDRRLSADERDRRLAELADERGQLERLLAQTVPAWTQRNEREVLGPEELIKALPRDVTFIDFFAYTRYEQDPQVPGKKGEKQTPSYLAFVLAPGRPIKRVELGPAEPIGESIAEWRGAIEIRKHDSAAQRLQEILWSKIAALIPAETRTLYLSPDGDLARLPWSALPTDKPHMVLLQRYALALVPHGTFLLGQLRTPAQLDGLDSALVLGDVNYGSGAWPSLPGAAMEQKAIRACAQGRGLATMTGTAATFQALHTTLPQMRFAHLATHGYFDGEAIRVEKNRARTALQDWQPSETGTPRRLAAKNPLAFTGLVLANGEIMSGLSVVDLPLENLKLVTLSACETGLGELTGGEGVQGLQRAFHLAGCPNVVASLWKVNDAATAALMAKFYHELWVNKKPPIEALREAQLTIYRRPDLIPDLAGERGALKQKESVVVQSTATSPVARKTADTKLWAAFVLSGVGK